MTEKALTSKQLEFCKAVVSGMSLSDAYRKAYNAVKMKSETINHKAYGLMKRGHIGAMVVSLREEVTKDFVINEADLLKEASRVAFSDVRRIYHDDGRIKMPYELDDDTAHAVASFEIDEYGRVKYKFWDKGSASDRLFKAGGLYAADNKQKAPAINIGRIELVAAVKPTT